MNQNFRYHLLAALLCVVFTAEVRAQGTAFTYQGRLDDNGTPANGVYSLRFTIYDASSGGSQRGPALTNNAVSVSNGLFTVALDFGAGVFTGEARWLEVWVAGQPLGSRQPIHPVPYAIYALNGGASSWTAGSGAVHTTAAVGIGTTNPQAELHVAGDLAELRIQDDDDPGSYTVVRDAAPTQMFLQKVNASGSSLIAIDPVVQDGTSDAIVRFFRGTSTTGNKAVIFNNGSGTTASSALIGVAGADSWFQAHGGNFGIGTAAPAQPLHVTGTARFGDGTSYAEFNGVTGEGLLRYNDTLGPKFIFRNSSAGSSTTIGRIVFEDPAQVAAIGYSRQFGSPAGLAFSGASSVHMKITDSGNLGIGTVNPAVRLHVEGGTDVSLAGGGFFISGSLSGLNIAMDNNEIMARDNGSSSILHLNADGGEVRVGQNSGGTGLLSTPVLQITGGSDLSEMFDVGGERAIEPGMVVCIDPQNPGRLIPSTSAYDPTVAGIVSGAGGVATGMRMGQAGSLAHGDHPVALSGRVYCLVDATGQRIVPGDMLTTSDTPGHAMKATERDRTYGAVIGKAMTPLEQGKRGLVLVLVNLQ